MEDRSPLHQSPDPEAGEPGPRHWMGAEADRGMQADHRFIWEAMLRTAGEDLRGEKVLDIGCNQGGLLRLIADRYLIAGGFGYDPAPGAVAEAERLKGDRPLHYVVADTVPDSWAGFDVAFSHEVLYLLSDLAAHARAVARALRSRGRYFAVMGTHDRNPLMARWHRDLSRRIPMPPIYSLEEVAGVFDEAGFDVSLARLDVGFMPAVGHRDPDLMTWLRYYHEDKILLRFLKS